MIEKLVAVKKKVRAPEMERRRYGRGWKGNGVVM